MRTTHIVIYDRMDFYKSVNDPKKEWSEGDVLFVINVFKHAREDLQRFQSLRLTDEYQYGIKYADLLKDLGQCCFKQILKNNVIYAGTRSRSKIVGRVA